MVDGGLCLHGPPVRIRHRATRIPGGQRSLRRLPRRPPDTCGPAQAVSYAHWRTRRRPGSLLPSDQPPAVEQKLTAEVAECAETSFYPIFLCVLRDLCGSRFLIWTCVRYPHLSDARRFPTPASDRGPRRARFWPAGVEDARFAHAVRVLVPLDAVQPAEPRQAGQGDAARTAACHRPRPPGPSVCLARFLSASRHAALLRPV